MFDPGKMNRRISIISVEKTFNKNGFPIETENVVLTCWAAIKTMRGSTFIRNNTEFSKALTRFTIRFPHAEINSLMRVKFRGKVYSIEYLNNVDEQDLFLEIEGKEITHG